MCVDPASMAAIGMMVGAGVSAAGALKQGQDAKAAGEYNAAALRTTAISEENMGAQKSADRIEKARRLEASQVAAAGAGGVSPSTGTPLKIEGQTMEMGELDSLRIINNAQRTAWGYQTEANIKEFEGGEESKASFVKAGSTLLGGGSNAYFGYQRATG